MEFPGKNFTFFLPKMKGLNAGLTLTLPPYFLRVMLNIEFSERQRTYQQTARIT
jgi:hypothetical protein